MTTTAEQIEAGLDPVDVALIAALVDGASTTEAAAAASVSATTAYRRMQSPAFRISLADAKAGRWRASAECLRDEVPRSIERLVALRDSEHTHPSTKLRAAETIITLALRFDEVVEVLPRVAAMEMQLSGLRDAGQQGGVS
jgi:hypothetical protein